MTFTFDGLSTGDGYRDPGTVLEDENSPHELQLAVDKTKQVL